MPKCDYKSKQKLTNMTCSSKTMTMTRGTTIIGEQQSSGELEAEAGATEQPVVQPTLEEGRIDERARELKDTGRIVRVVEMMNQSILRNMDQKTHVNQH